MAFPCPQHGFHGRSPREGHFVRTGSKSRDPTCPFPARIAASTGDPRLASILIGRDHGERNHQGIGNRLLFPEDDLRDDGPIATRERLGGKLKYYYREAA